MSVGNRIRDIRLELGETMEEFGKRFDTSKGTINNWENDRNKPNKPNLKTIADVGKISVEELLYGDQCTKITVENKLFENLRRYIEIKKRVLKERIRLSDDVSTFLLSSIDFKELRIKAVEDYEEYQKKINLLEEFGELYISENFVDYTYAKYLKEYPKSDTQGFEDYKEKEWCVLEQLLDNYWLRIDKSNEEYLLINKSLINEILAELKQIKKS